MQGKIYSDGHDTYTREEIEKLCRKMIGGHGTEIDVIKCTHEIYTRTLTAIIIMSVIYLVEVCKKNISMLLSSAAQYILVLLKFFLP